MKEIEDLRKAITLADMVNAIEAVGQVEEALKYLKAFVGEGKTLIESVHAVCAKEYDQRAELSRCKNDAELFRSIAASGAATEEDLGRVGMNALAHEMCGEDGDPNDLHHEAFATWDAETNPWRRERWVRAMRIVGLVAREAPVCDEENPWSAASILGEPHAKAFNLVRDLERTQRITVLEAKTLRDGMRRSNSVFDKEWLERAKEVFTEARGTPAAPTHPHLIDGEFQSDKYPTTPTEALEMRIAFGACSAIDQDQFKALSDLEVSVGKYFDALDKVTPNAYAKALNELEEAFLMVHHPTNTLRGAVAKFLPIAKTLLDDDSRIDEMGEECDRQRADEQTKILRELGWTRGALPAPLETDDYLAEVKKQVARAAPPLATDLLRAIDSCRVPKEHADSAETQSHSEQALLQRLLDANWSHAFNIALNGAGAAILRVMDAASQPPQRDRDAWDCLKYERDTARAEKVDAERETREARAHYDRMREAGDVSDKVMLLAQATLTAQSAELEALRRVVEGSQASPAVVVTTSTSGGAPSETAASAKTGEEELRAATIAWGDAIAAETSPGEPFTLPRWTRDEYRRDDAHFAAYEADGSTIKQREAFLVLETEANAVRKGQARQAAMVEAIAAVARRADRLLADEIWKDRQRIDELESRLTALEKGVELPTPAPRYDPMAWREWTEACIEKLAAPKGAGK